VIYPAEHFLSERAKPPKDGDAKLRV